MKITSRTALRKGSALVDAMLLGSLMAGSVMFAQTPVVPKKPPLPVAKPNAAVAKPVAKPAPVAKTVATTPVAKATSPATTAKPVAATTAIQKTAPTTTGAAPATASSAVPPATTGVSNAVSSTAATATNVSSTGLGALSSASTASNGYAQPGGDPRAPVAGQGIGTFLWPGGWTLTAYGCFRTGTRLFCDFDTTNQGNVYANSSAWSGGGGVNVVDDGGKITGRHNAFFVGTDGSQFPDAYITPQPVRFVIEYDDIDERFTAVSLVLGRDRIQGIPITAIDPSVPAGRIPERVSSGAAAQGTQTAAAPGAPGATNGIDKATQGINNLNDQKQKAQNLWQSMQNVAKPH